MGNSLCKMHCSKDEINVVEINKKKLQKMKKNVTKESFYCLVSKTGKVFHV